MTQAPLRLEWEGYLQKRSDWLKHWETYYLILRGRYLYCYLSEEDARAPQSKSRIKKGKIGFADRVILAKAYDVDNGSDTASPFRFTLETVRGHHLHFRTNSEASKYSWLQVVGDAIHDHSVENEPYASVQALTTSTSDFYRAYEYLARSLGDHVSSQMMFPDRSSVSSSSSSEKRKEGVLVPISPSSPVHVRGSTLDPPKDHTVLRFFSLLDTDIVVRTNYLPMVPFEGKYRNFPGVLEYFSRLAEAVVLTQFSVEQVEWEDRSERTSSRSDRVLLVRGRETMQVRSNHATFMQQWVHKLHLARDKTGRIRRWEIFGDVVASSVVFKPPESVTDLTLPPLAERIRETVVGGHVVCIKVQHVTDVRAHELQNDKCFIRCSLDTNEFEGVWHTEAQSTSVSPQPVDYETSSYPFDGQCLYLQFDRLSRDDNTILLLEFCRHTNREVVARTHINLASFLNQPTMRKWKKSEHDSSYVLSNDHQSYFGKLEMHVEVSNLSMRSERQSDVRDVERSSFSIRDKDIRLPSISRFGIADQDADLRMHQFIINGVRYQLAEKYRMVKVVGRGTYGEVIAACDFVHGGTYAIKKLGQFLRHPKVALLALRELQLMNTLGTHPNLIPIHELQRPVDYANFTDLYIIQPLMETDLSRIIHSHQPLSDDQIQFFIYQLLRGIHYLHSANVLHRDLKPSNLLVNSDCTLRIADFGLARHADDEMGEAMSEYVVTRWYRAPELLLANTYDRSVDMWSVGCILAELLGRKVLFPGQSYVDQLRLIVDVLGTPSTFSFCDNPSARRFAGRQFLAAAERKERMEWECLFPEANPEAIDLLDKLLVFNPNDRLSAKEALEHAYVSGWRDESAEAECSDDVRERVRRQGQAQLPMDPEGIKELLFEEVMKRHTST